MSSTKKGVRLYTRDNIYGSSVISFCIPTKSFEQRFQIIMTIFYYSSSSLFWSQNFLGAVTLDTPPPLLSSSCFEPSTGSVWAVSFSDRATHKRCPNFIGSNNHNPKLVFCRVEIAEYDKEADSGTWGVKNEAIRLIFFTIINNSESWRELILLCICNFSYGSSHSIANMQ